MTWFVEKALDQTPIPASIYDASTLSFIAENAAARKLKGFIEDGLTAEERRRRLAEQLTYTKQAPGKKWHVVREYGVWVLSIFPAERWHARPDLILMTCHLETDPRDDLIALNHERVRWMLAVREATEKALHAIETAGTMLSAAAAGLEAMENFVTEAVADQMADKKMQEVPPGVLTELRKLHQG